MKLYSKIRENKTRVKIPFLSVTGTLCGAFTLLKFACPIILTGFA